VFFSTGLTDATEPQKLLGKMFNDNSYLISLISKDDKVPIQSVNNKKSEACNSKNIY
jgi:hypothetical protein